jgi:hypothetical protein
VIKTLGIKDGRPLFMFGLSRRNCELLLAGKPIVIDLRQMKENAENLYAMVCTAATVAADAADALLAELDKPQGET